MEIEYADFERESLDLQAKLLASSASFIDLYGQHRDDLLTTSNKFAQIAANVRKSQEESSKKMIAQRMFGALGGAMLGASTGAVTGAVGGAIGAVAVATYSRYFSNINAVCAVGGFVSSVIGGVSGGAVCGGVGGAIGSAALISGSSTRGKVSIVVWSAIGGAAGSALGGIFGGSVGIVGGAIGGAFGAFCGASVAVGTIGNIVDINATFYQQDDSRDSTKQEKEIKEVKIIQRMGRDFCEAVRPLVKELKSIKEISDEMDLRGASVHAAAAAQTVKTLAAVTAMDKSISDRQKPKCAVAMIEQAARQCEQTTEEFERMRVELVRLLASLTES